MIHRKIVTHFYLFSVRIRSCMWTLVFRSIIFDIFTLASQENAVSIIFLNNNNIFNKPKTMCKKSYLYKISGLLSVGTILINQFVLTVNHPRYQRAKHFVSFSQLVLQLSFPIWFIPHTTSTSFIPLLNCRCVKSIAFSMFSIVILLFLFICISLL